MTILSPTRAQPPDTRAEYDKFIGWLKDRGYQLETECMITDNYYRRHTYGDGLFGVEVSVRHPMLKDEFSVMVRLRVAMMGKYGCKDVPYGEPSQSLSTDFVKSAEAALECVINHHKEYLAFIDTLAGSK